MQAVADPKLNETDHGILDRLAEGRNVPANIAEELDVSRQYIHQRMSILETADYIRNIGRGVYELLDDPRSDEAPKSASTPAEEDLACAIRGLRSALTALEGSSPDTEMARREIDSALERLETNDG